MKYNNISIVIPFYNDKYIIDCIESLIIQKYPCNFYEIIVVDNNSEESYLSLLDKYKDKIKLIHQQKRGSYHCRNLGTFYAKGNILAFTDSDCVIEPGWLEKINKFFSTHDESFVAVQGQSFSFGGTEVATAIAEMYVDTFQTYVNNEQQGRFCSRLDTRNCAIRYDAFREIGLFHEEMLYWADAEFGMRLCEKGYKIQYLPKMNIRHHDIDNLELYLRKRQKEGKNVADMLWKAGAKYVRKYYPEMLFLFIIKRKSKEKYTQVLSDCMEKLESYKKCSEKQQKVQCIKTMSSSFFMLGILEALGKQGG